MSNNSNWISVKERMPAIGSDVLACTFYGGIIVERVYRDPNSDEIRPSFAHLYRPGEAYAITHWMPLPEPPAETKAENKRLNKLIPTKRPKDE